MEFVLCVLKLVSARSIDSVLLLSLQVSHIYIHQTIQNTIKPNKQEEETSIVQIRVSTTLSVTSMIDCYYFIVVISQLAS